MLNKKLVQLHLLMAVSIALLSACAIGSSSAGRPGKSSTPFDYTYDETHAFPISQKIRVTSEDAEVIVTGSDRTDVRVQVHYALSADAKVLQRFDYKVNVHSDGGELRVDELRSTGSRNFVYDQRAHRITIEVPRSADVTIQEEDGACEITSITGSVNVRMNDGKVHAADCTGAVTVSIDDGTFTQRNCTGLVQVHRR